jgi:hypothetical protein
LGRNADWRLTELTAFWNALECAIGYSPAVIEKDDGGLSVLIFRPLPDDQMFGLVQALPVHLSARIGTVMSNQTSLASKLDP